jgi:hypothetical protein
MMPTAMVAMASTAKMGCHVQRMPSSATKKTRMSATTAASLVQIAMNPVTGVGAPM